MKTGHNCIQYQCNLGRVWKLQTSSSRITTRLLVACLFVSLATVPFAKAKVRRYKGEIGTPWFDGTGVTQCPIVPGYTFTCVFVVDRPGTYLYHAHCSMQREAGLYGSIRVSLSKGESEPFSYDYDRSIILSGWYHKSTYEQAAGLSSIPFVWVGEPDSHNMTVVETDGRYVESFVVQSLLICSGETYCCEKIKSYWASVAVVSRSRTTPNGLAVVNYYPNHPRRAPPTVPPPRPLWSDTVPSVHA